MFVWLCSRGEKKGSLVPPVVVDVNKDGVQDILVSMYDGKVQLIDGNTAEKVWETGFPGMESYRCAWGLPVMLYMLLSHGQKLSLLTAIVFMSLLDSELFGKISKGTTGEI